MRYVVPFFLLLFACHHEPTPATPELEGLWIRITPAEPSWRWHFCDGTVTQFILSQGDTVEYRQHPYTQREHILHIGDSPDYNRLVKLAFESDTVIHYTDITPGNALAYTLLLGKKK
jgi:hypothetical protein